MVRMIVLPIGIYTTSDRFLYLVELVAECEHINCGSIEKVWLPHTYQGRECGLKPHTYCTKCGLVKNLSSEKPRSIGYYMNILAEIKQEFKITKVQTRLISKELENADLEDDYAIDKHQQEELFVATVEKYINLPDWVVRKFL